MVVELFTNATLPFGRYTRCVIIGEIVTANDFCKSNVSRVLSSLSMSISVKVFCDSKVKRTFIFLFKDAA